MSVLQTLSNTKHHDLTETVSPNSTIYGITPAKFPAYNLQVTFHSDAESQDMQAKMLQEGCFTYTTSNSRLDIPVVPRRGVTPHGVSALIIHHMPVDLVSKNTARILLECAGYGNVEMLRG